MKKITIKDVARESGVSLAIASFALNDVKGRVSSEVREKVLDCAKRLGYTANTFAKNLRSKNSNTIALVYDKTYLDERNASTFQFVAGALKYAKEKGKDLLVKLIDMESDVQNSFEEYVELWVSQRVDGIIFQCAGKEDGLIKRMHKENVSFVIIPAVKKLSGVDSVYIDNYRIMKEGVAFLYKKGYREIFFLTMKNLDITERELGFTDAIRNFGINGRPLYYTSRYRNKAELWDVLKVVVEGRKDRLAIACWNDVDAINVMEILHSKGIKIPEDIGVMGFDDIPASEHTYPALTTIRQPFDEMAKKAIDILICKHEKNDIVVQSVEITGSIIERQSV